MSTCEIAVQQQSAGRHRARDSSGEPQLVLKEDSAPPSDPYSFIRVYRLPPEVVLRDEDVIPENPYSFIRINALPPALNSSRRARHARLRRWWSMQHLTGAH